MKSLLILLFACFSVAVIAHPMPCSVLMLDVRSDGISAELKWPLKEFQPIFPDMDIDSHPDRLLDDRDKWLDDYLRAHMSISDSAGHLWTILIQGKKVSNAEQEATGRYHELTFYLRLQPPAGASMRHFIIHYDAIMHQVVTHKLLIKIRQDWDSGLIGQDSGNEDLGVLMMNTSDNVVPPVVVNLDEGNKWKGFMSMVRPGMQHISEGTDHLLFLLVLLLPSVLLVSNGRWAGFGGTTYSLIRLLKIVTAFTIGHSVSLILGSLRLLVLPQQFVEIAIGITILVTAIHALRPIFAGREVFVAAFFGIIHGLAFSTVISGLNLDSGRMAISILGFNIGIEIMQLFVIISTVPWLIILAQNQTYQWLRVTGALLAIITSIGWIAERISGQSNIISINIEKVAAQSKWLVLGLVIFASGSSIWRRIQNKRAAL